MIDCGVPYIALSKAYEKLKLVLLTHIHSDHFNARTIKKLARERPTLRFGCCEWIVSSLVECGVNKGNVDVLEMGKWHEYNTFLKLSPVKLCHDVPNCGYKVHITGEKLFYATDTNSLNGIDAKLYDLYLIEANYEHDEINKRISAKEIAGEYAYERNVLKNHLSKAAADDFIYRNIGTNGEYVYLHSHID